MRYIDMLRRSVAMLFVTLLASFTLVAQGPAGAPQGAQPGAPQGRGGRAGGPPDIRGVVVPATTVVGVGNYVHTVGNLDKAVAFYRDAVGLEFTGQIGRPAQNAELARLYNTPGASIRSAVMTIPKSRFGMEFIEFTGIDRKTNPVLQQVDPGNSDLNMTVPDLAATWTRIEQMGGKGLTENGKPRAQGTGGVVFLNDPEGCVLEIRQPGAPQGGGPIADNAWPAVIAMTTVDSPKKAAFYRDLLGFSSMQEGMPRMGNVGVMGMVGGRIPEGADPQTVGSEQSQTNVPGTDVRFEFYQYWGVPSSAFKPRMQDACATVFQLRVKDIGQMMTTLRAANVPIVTAGGQPVMINGVRRLVVLDPDGVYVELMQ